MGRMINIGYGNVVNADKILAVVKPEAAPIKRMVAVAKDHDTYVDATCGRKCKSVIVSVEGRIVRKSHRKENWIMLHPSYTDLMQVVNKEVEPGEEPVVNSRYSIVLATAKRARQLIDGAEPYVIPSCNKALSIAVDELYNSKVKIISEDKEN